MVDTIKGKVKWFSNKSKYGFITGEDNRDYYFHEDDLKGFSLERSDEVAFKPIKTKRDWRAKGIKLIAKAEKNSNLIPCKNCLSEITPRLITKEVYPTRFKCIKKVEKSFVCPNCEHHLGVYESESPYQHIASNLIISILCIALLTGLFVLKASSF